MISRVIFPGFLLFITNLSISITGSTPTVVLVRKASLQFFISSIQNESSFIKKLLSLANLITQSLVTLKFVF